MRVRDEVRIAFGALLVIQVVTAFAAIALLGRMSPAIERIIQENVYSITAVEQMLGALVEREASPEEARAHLDEALERAEGNVTEEAERPALEAIRRDAPPALAGDGGATQRALKAMQELGDINRASMRRADDDAKALGEAGAWAVAALGLLGFIGSLWISRRLSRRISEPVSEIYDALLAFNGGDDHRGCVVSGAPVEIQALGDSLNALFRAISTREGGGSRGTVDRAFVLWTLDQMEEPAALFDTRGLLIATNRGAGERLGDALRRELRDRIDAGDDLPEGLEREEIRGAGVLIRWAGAAAPGATTGAGTG